MDFNKVIERVKAHAADAADRVAGHRRRADHRPGPLQGLHRRWPRCPRSSRSSQSSRHPRPFAGPCVSASATRCARPIVNYAVSLPMVYVMALIVDALAPSFGGQKDRLQALKVIAYSSTAVWVAAIGYDRAVPVVADPARGPATSALSAVSRLAAHDEVSAGSRRRLHGRGDHHRDIVGLVRRHVQRRPGMGSFMTRRATYAGQRHTFDKDSSLGRIEEYGQRSKRPASGWKRHRSPATRMRRPRPCSR